MTTLDIREPNFARPVAPHRGRIYLGVGLLTVHAAGGRAMLEAAARGFGAVYRNMDYTGGYLRIHNDAHMSVGVMGIDITQPCSTCCMCLCRPAEMQ